MKWMLVKTLAETWCNTLAYGNIVFSTLEERVLNAAQSCKEDPLLFYSLYLCL